MGHDLQSPNIVNLLTSLVGTPVMCSVEISHGAGLIEQPLSSRVNWGPDLG